MTCSWAEEFWFQAVVTKSLVNPLLESITFFG
jgi:hypothetical protein